MCGTHARALVHQGLDDRLFGAPGTWNMYRCAGCALAYLDPRPDAVGIALAYRSYYTHEEASDDEPIIPGNGFVTGWKQRVLRDYLHSRYGATRGPWHGLLAPLMFLRPRARRMFDMSMRQLPRPRPGARLLDVGCGGGRFLAWARTFGWMGTGTDPDPLAVRRTQQRGIDASSQDLSELERQGLRFDAITISHVIEHVHEPQRLLRDARRLLKPGGHFWIETPNIDSWGHRCFGRHWRGLEPPRHLQLFHPELLVRLLQDAGFVEIRTGPWKSDWEALAPASMEIARQAGADLEADPGPHPERVGRNHPQRRELITLTATVRAHA